MSIFHSNIIIILLITNIFNKTALNCPYANILSDNHLRDLSANKLGDNFTIVLSEDAHLQGLKINKNQLTEVPDMFFVKNITHLAL